MAKKGNYSKPIGDMPTKQSIRDSKSYKRVKNNGNFEGIFLFKHQLEQLIEKIPSNANGLWFVIGDIIKNEDLTHLSSKTIEVLPAKFTLNSPEIIIPVSSYIKGKLHTDFEEILRNDKDYYVAIDGAALPGPTTPSQRTPPPRPEE